MNEGYTNQSSNKKSSLNIKTIVIIGVVLAAVIVAAVVLTSNSNGGGIGSNNDNGIIGSNRGLAGTSYSNFKSEWPIRFTDGNNVTIDLLYIERPYTHIRFFQGQYTLNGDELTITRDVYGTPEYYYGTFVKDKRFMIFYDELYIKDGLQYDKVSGKYELFTEDTYYDKGAYFEFKEGNKVTFSSNRGYGEGTYSIDGNEIGMNFSNDPSLSKIGTSGIMRGTIIDKDIIKIGAGSNAMIFCK